MVCQGIPKKSDPVILKSVKFFVIILLVRKDPMANPEHLKIIKQGVKVWNKWREGNLKVEPDFLKLLPEVIPGYIMLGGLISILATKLARRS